MEDDRSVRKMLVLFREIWPQTFTDPPQPLKIGILQDILDSGLPAERPFNEREAGKFLCFYVRKIGYKKALQVAGRARIDLDGQPVGEVSPEAAESVRVTVFDYEQAKKNKKLAKAEAAAALLAAKAAAKAAKVAKKEQKQQAAAALVPKEAEVQQPKQVNVEYRRRRMIDQSKLG